ncbi:MAG: hypothetical protein PHH54_01635 [Candidatus Nanoarchaeia archaeon]|nr:hypothetical protein [Candidatus Nanoarchaeia archaeon]MDD5740664.1 hypothetical protein [Candidatus Nanoarchaeia archaeon]
MAATQNIYEQLELDAQKGERLNTLKQKVESVRQANQDYLQTYKLGTAQVLQGKQREASEKSKLEISAERNNELTTYVANTVDALGSEFGSVEEYLEGVDIYVGKEKFAKLFSSKWATDLKTKRILNTSLADNIGQILKYYADMRDVMYSSAVENKKAVKEIRSVRDNTLEKLNENEKSYNEQQQTRNTLETKLAEIDKELATLTGEKRVERELERTGIKDELDTARNAEDYHFSIVKNAQDDLQYQERNLEQYENVVRALATSISDMQQKIDNRTILFQKIETLVKTVYRVKSASLADKAMNKTTAEITKTAVTAAEGILDELGMRKLAKPMSPDELAEWKARGIAAREGYENILNEEKAAYAAPGTN